MKAIFSIILILGITVNLSACNPDNDAPPKEEGQTEQPGNNGNQNNPPSNNKTMKLKMTFGNKELTATFQNNATSRAFIEKLPLTLPMQDLYFREMCYRFPDALPANEASVRGYETGEIIYYPPLHSFVIMYAQNGERFNMQTIGRVDSNVEVFKNIGNINVRFELIKEE
ncbi:MAG: hypothetical protein LBJ63_00780 [Prevotellaceae bacterium]|jgi:hypothetical protein|nr:hypothetical protein [Prevotellaceae bacterium]